MTAPDRDDIHRARLDGLAEGMTLTEEGIAVIAAAMNAAADILHLWPNAAENPWLEPTTRALVAAVQRFAAETEDEEP
jgi:hypothetical protein